MKKSFTTTVVLFSMFSMFAMIATAQTTTDANTVSIGEKIQTIDQRITVDPVSLSQPRIGACEILLADTIQVVNFKSEQVFLRLVGTKINGKVRTKNFGCVLGTLFVMSSSTYSHDLKPRYLAVKEIDGKTTKR